MTRGHTMPPQVHVCNGLVREWILVRREGESMLARYVHRDNGTYGENIMPPLQSMLCVVCGGIKISNID